MQCEVQEPPRIPADDHMTCELPRGEPEWIIRRFVQLELGMNSESEWMKTLSNKFLT